MTQSGSNFLKFLVAVGVIAGLSLGLEYAAYLFVNVPWRLSTTIWVVVSFFLGALSYFLFVGSFIARAVWITAAPLVSAGLLEITYGSDAAYPYIGLFVGAAESVLFFLGCAAAWSALKVLGRDHGQQHA